MMLVKETEPVVRRPVVRAQRNRLLERFFGVIQPAQLLVRIGETSLRGVARRFHLDRPAVLLECLFVAACADKPPAAAEVSRRKRGFTLSCLLAILDGCIRPLLAG